MLRRGLTLGALLIVTVALVLPGTSGAADGHLRATYRESARWDTGYVGLIELTNTGSETVVDWVVTFELATDTTITSWWNAQLTREGTLVTATPESWTTTIAAGATITFGWEALGLSAPTDITTGDTPTPPLTTTTATPTSTQATTTTTTTTTTPAPTTIETTTTHAPTTTKAPTTTSATTTTTTPPFGGVKPILECVEYLGGQTMRAYFGYDNPSGVTVDIPVGLRNGFVPLPGDRGQPTTFSPGRSAGWPNAAFSVEFTSTISWFVDGRAAVASIASRPCVQRVQIDTQWVNANGAPIEPPTGVRAFRVGAVGALGTANCRIAPNAKCVYKNAPAIGFDHALAVPAGSTYFVHPTSLLPRNVTIVSGVGYFNASQSGCSSTNATCTHTLVIEYHDTRPTTTTTQPTTSTQAPTTSTQPTTSTEAPNTSTTTRPTTTTTQPTTSTQGSTTSTQPTTSTEAPNTSTTAPTTTAPITPGTDPVVPDDGNHSELVVENATAEPQTFTVECDRSVLDSDNTTFTLTPGATRTIAVVRGDYCTVHTAARDGGDTIVLPQYGAAVIDAETGSRAGWGGSWICTPMELFVARAYVGSVTKTEIEIVGLRPAQGCTIALIVPESSGSSSFPWPLVALGGFFSALIAFAIWRVVTKRDPGLDPF